MRTDNAISSSDHIAVQRVHACVYDLNAALSALAEAGFASSVETYMTGGGVDIVKVEVFRFYPPDEQPIAISEPA